MALEEEDMSLTLAGWEALKEHLGSQGNAQSAELGAGGGGFQWTSLPLSAEILNV